MRTGIERSFHTVKAGKENRHCPECHDQQLAKIIVQVVELELCPECIGLFFDEDEIKEFLPEAESRTIVTGVDIYLLNEGLYWVILAFLFGRS
ncbi:MAG: zf-TFIIB domain-containing protein [Candidatus Thiodiazotropha sp.]